MGGKIKGQMETQEKVELIQKIVEHHKNLNKTFDNIGEIFGTYPEGRLWDQVWNLFDLTVTMTESTVGDESNWINWYLWERTPRANTVTLEDGTEIVVDSVEKLVQIIEDK
jgi:hypothetical protein